MKKASIFVNMDNRVQVVLVVTSVEKHQRFGSWQPGAGPVRCQRAVSSKAGSASGWTDLGTSIVYSVLEEVLPIRQFPRYGTENPI